MKTIQLKSRGIGQYLDGLPFPVGVLELQILGIPAYSGEFRFVAECNGVKVCSQAVTPESNIVHLAQEQLSAGRFSCAVWHYVGGEAVKKYPVEDLIITDLSGGLEADPELAQMIRRVAELEALTASQAAEISALRQVDADIAQAVEGLNTAVTQLQELAETLAANNDIFNT